MFGTYEFQPLSVKDVLSSIRVDELRTMIKTVQRQADGHPGKKVEKPRLDQPASHRKGDLVDWLVGMIIQQKTAKFIYEMMHSLEKNAMSEVVHHPQGVFDPVQIEAKYGAYPDIYGFKLTRISGKRIADKGKKYCPLLKIVLAEKKIMARDVQRTYRQFVPHPAATVPGQIEKLPENLSLPSGETTSEYNVVLTEQSALIDVQAMLNLVTKGKVGVGAKTGRISKSGVKNVRQALGQGDFYPPEEETGDDCDVQMGPAGIRPFAWPLLLQAANLAQIEGSKLALTRSGQAALKKKPHEVIKTLWERWLKTTVLHEMNRIEVVKGQKSKKRPLHQARMGRENLAQGLADLEPCKWILLEDFFKYLFARGDVVDIVRSDWPLYILDPEHGSFGYAHITWDHLTGRFARAFLLEYAATLGIIDVALVPPWGAVSDVRDLWGADNLTCLSRYDGLLAMRLTPLGAWVLGQTETYTPAPPTYSLQIVSEQEIRVLDAGPGDEAKTRLERFCIQEDDQTFRLDGGKALQAMEQGMSGEEMREALVQGSGQELPAQVAAFVTHMEQRAGLFRIAGQGLVVECSDPNVRNAVLGDAKMRSLCLPAGDSALVVRKEDEEAFRDCLHKLGYALPLG
ncbi:MAG: hypothetical protein ACLFT5_03150 [Desulfovermiculus sp.]